MSDCGRTGGMDTILAVLNVVEPGPRLHVWGSTRHASSSTRSFSRGLPVPNPVSDPTAPARIGLAAQAAAQWPLLMVVAASKPTLLAPVRKHYRLVRLLAGTARDGATRIYVREAGARALRARGDG